jgi:hypothetical protein
VRYPASFPLASRVSRVLTCRALLDPGHPLGCTGARQIATALPEAKRKGHKVFVTSMCVGSGQVRWFLFLDDGTHRPREC